MENLILNRYRPLGSSTQGGFATVELAWDTRIQRRVAIKRLQVDGFKVAGDTEVSGLTEARTAALLNQENIVSVYDFEIEDDSAYLIMEFVDGITLAQLMRDHTHISKDIVAAIFEGVAHALETAHENQVLHLDIKPDNILIDRSGRVKVTDFGLSQLSHEAGFGRASGGTIGYMPLEQMRLETPDERTDEWALAAIVYQMLTNDNPFMAKDVDEAQVAIEHAEMLIPSMERDDITEAVDEILFKALSVEKEQRYPSVLDFAIALRPYIGSPKRGVRMLSEIVSALDDEVDKSETLASHAIVPGVLAPREEGSVPYVPSKWFIKLVAGISAALIVGISLHNMPWLNTAIVHTTGSTAGLNATQSMQATIWVGALLAAVVGFVSTRVAALVAPLMLSIALLLQHNFILGSLVLLATLLWWAFVARVDRNAATTGLSSVLFGIAWMSPALSLVAGFNTTTKRAVATSIYAGVLMTVFALANSMTLVGFNALTSLNFSQILDTHIPSMFANFAPWIHLLSWSGAAFVTALLAHNKRPLVRVCGVAVGLGILVFGMMLAHFLSSGFDAWIPPMRLFVPTIVAGVCIALVAFSFAVKLPEKPVQEQ